MFFYVVKTIPQETNQLITLLFKNPPKQNAFGKWYDLMGEFSIRMDKDEEFSGLEIDKVYKFKLKHDYDKTNFLPSQVIFENGTVTMKFDIPNATGIYKRIDLIKELTVANDILKILKEVEELKLIEPEEIYINNEDYNYELSLMEKIKDFFKKLLFNK